MTSAIPVTTQKNQYDQPTKKPARRPRMSVMKSVKQMVQTNLSQLFVGWSRPSRKWMQPAMSPWELINSALAMVQEAMKK